MNERRTSRGTTGGAGGDGGAGRLWARGRSLRVSAVAVAVGLLGLGSGLAGAVGAASAAASTTTPGFSVGSPVLTRTSTSAGATDVTYTATFLATHGLSVNASSTVTLVAPPGTVFPTNACDYQVGDVTTGQTNTFFCRPTLTGAGTAAITLTVDTSAGNGDQYAVTVEGVANPTSAASGTLSLSTSSDQTPVAVPDATAAATSVTTATLTRTSSSAGATDVTWVARFLATDGLSSAFTDPNADASTVTLAAPAGTVFPTNACDYQVRDVTTGQSNTFFCRPTLTGAGTATITLAVDTSAGPRDEYAVIVEGVANPTSAASGTLSLSTSSDQTPVAVPDATAAATAVTGAVLTRTSTAAGATDVTWVARFLATDGLSSAFTDPNADASTVTLAAPAGTVFPTNLCDYQVRDVTTGQSNTCPSRVTGAGTDTVTLAVSTPAGVGDDYSVTVTGVTNPTSAEPLHLSTSSDPEPVAVSDAPTQTGSVAPATLTRTSSSAGATETTYSVAFVATGGLTAGSSTVTLAGPSGTVFPTNGCALSVDLTTGQSSGCQPVSGGGSATAVVTVNTSAAPGDQYAMVVYGVANPTSAASGNLSLSTSSDPTPVSLADDTTAATAVSGVTLSRTSSSAGATELTYTAAFTATNGLDTGFNFGTDASTVTLSGPSGTVFPSGCAAYNIVDLTTGQRGNCQSVAGGGTATAVVTVAASAGPGDQYAINFAGVSNPTTAATGTLGLSTSSDPTPVALSDDTAAAQPVGSPSVSLSDYVSGSTGVTYAVGFTTSGLDSGFSFGTDASTIILAAPAGTVFPSAGNAYQVTDNTTGTNATASGVTLSSSGATATVTVPVDVSPGGGVAVTITGVTNPAATGTQDLAISTTSDTQANAQYTLGAGGPISGSVTYQGSPVVGAPVQACPSSGPCATGTTDGSGQYSLLVIDGTYEMTAFPSTSVDASQGTAGPVVVSSSAGVSGVAVALSAPPSIPAGVTLTSPSFGTITSSTATPVINWHQPTEVSLDPSLFGPTGTHVVLHGFQVSGTSSVTGLRETEFLPVGGGSPSVASGGVFGPYGGCANSPGLVLAGPVTTEALYPFHGPAIITPEATVYPPGTPPEIEVAAPCSLFFPTENTGDTGTVYFTNFAAQGGITVGKGSIVGGDYKDFSITTAVTPPGTADCGNTLVDMPQDQTPSSDATPPGSQCGIGVHWVPVDGKHYEFSTLEVHVGPTLYPVELIACNDDAGVGQCDPDEEPPEPTDDQPPLPYPEPKPGPHINPYVDPSGTVQVQTPSGPAPLAGASVTLSGGPGQGGPFSPVPDGSAIMAPSNRQNPSVSDALGTFGWDTLAGYYQVSATKSGCDSAATNGFGVPPPVSDLSLTLTCTAPPVRAQTSTGLAGSPTSATFGQLVTLTATVKRSGGGGPPPGAVTFLDGTTSLGQAVVDPTSGTAQLQTSVLPAGKHTITASYGGSGTDAPSTSTAVTVTVSSPGAPAPPCTAVSLTASPREAAIGTKVELTASAKGCTSATYTFTGIALIRGAASFTIGTTTSPSLAWDTTGARAAFYEVKVSARAPGQASAVTSSHQIVILYPPYRPKA